MASEQLVWRGVGMVAGIAAAFVTRKILRGAWQASTGTDPPANPAAPGTTWREAISWAVASGVAVAVARLVAQRGAAEAWRAAKGSYPEGLETVTP
jgi:hypothetical protein